MNVKSLLVLFSSHNIFDKILHTPVHHRFNDM